MGASWNNYWQEQGITPDAEFNWQKYQEFTTPPETMSNYADLDQWEGEGSLFGPISSNIDLLLSGKYPQRRNPVAIHLELQPRMELHFQAQLPNSRQNQTHIVLYASGNG